MKEIMKESNEIIHYSAVTQYQINFTYRCNLKCKWCIEHLNKLPWPDSDITVEDIKLGGRIAKNYVHQVGKLRISGGEPMLHPRVVECCKAIKESWNGDRLFFFTNGTFKLIKDLPVTYRVAPPSDWKKKSFGPPMISPMDLGLQPMYGFTRPCDMMNKSGRLFDAFGFSFCQHAGTTGRLLGIDAYEPRPVLLGIPSMCQHCIFTVPRKKQVELWQAVRDKKIEYPTKTYKEGLKRALEEPIKFKKFQERFVEAHKESSIL